MKEFIIENLAGNAAMDVITIFWNNVAAMAAAFFIMFVYKVTYFGVAYSRRFHVSLGAIAITTTMIMGIISNNIALSLGMVGALSIIRFRTAVKDVRDAVFIFWAIAVGIGCGVAQYSLVGIGSVFLLLFMLLTRQTISSGQQLLIVQASLEAQNGIEAVVEEYFEGKAHQTVKNATSETCEMIYKVAENVLKKANKKQMSDIVQSLLRLEGVIRVHLVEQQEDISR